MATKAKMTLGQGLISLVVCLTMTVAVYGQGPEPAASAPAANDAVATTPTAASIPVAPRIIGDIYVEAIGTSFQDLMTMDPLLIDLAEAPFDEVLLRVRQNGYAYYKSRISPRPIGVSENFDPLAEAIGQLHSAARSKKVIAWFSPYRMTDASGDKLTAFTEGHVMNSNLVKGKPDALLSGDNQKIYLNPRDPAIQARLESLVTELASRYEIDGLLLDLELPAVVEDPARWTRFDWDAFAASVQGMIKAAREARPGMIIGVADHDLGSRMGDYSVNFRSRWLNGQGLNRLYCTSYINDQSGSDRFDAAAEAAVEQASAASLQAFIGVAGDMNEAVNALAQCKRAAAMGAEGIALAEFSQPVLDPGARKLFINALKSAVLGDGGLRVTARVDRSRFQEAVAASLSSAEASEEIPTTVTQLVMGEAEDAETVFEMPPPPEAVGDDQVGSDIESGIDIAAVQDEQTSPSESDELAEALDKLTGIVDEAPEKSGPVLDIKTSQAVLTELLKDPRFSETREWKVLAPEVKAREELKSTFPNIF